MSQTNYFIGEYMSSQRPRRNRKSTSIRELLAETCLNSSHLIYPVFICDGQGLQEPLRTLPGQYRWSLDLLSKKIGEWQKVGLKHFALFPKIDDKLKDSHGKEALN